MRQEINLYQPVFRRQRKVFSALAMVQVLGLVVVGLIAIYGYGQWQGSGLQQEVQRLEVQRDGSRERLQRMQRDLAGREPSRTLEREKAALEQRLRQQRRVVEFLTEGELGVAKGFSRHLEGLARQQQDGMWLTQVHLYNGGLHMDLMGVALAERLVPRYVSRLGEEAVFEGTEFRRVQLHRSEQNPRQVSFELRSAMPEQAQRRRR